jgi:hypothetical protein
VLPDALEHREILGCDHLVKRVAYNAPHTKILELGIVA